MLSRTLNKYQGVTNLSQLNQLKSHQPPTPVCVPVPVPVPEDPFSLVSNFFSSVTEKIKNRDPVQSPDPLKHFMNVVQESYTEQGGKEGLDKVVKHVVHLTTEEVTKIDRKKIQERGFGPTILDGLKVVEHQGLEAGGLMMDHLEQLQKVVTPYTQEVNTALGVSTIKAGEVLAQVQDDWSKGVIQEKIKTETERGLGSALELCSVLVQVGSQIQEVLNFSLHPVSSSFLPRLPSLSGST
eukprot:TRINITY_DN6269_c0_g1_i10.p1 TRINITY_DN6269_c0_g1~~TRINITY_DN6269_c0_g1_i10.p1  ORF type:complete len:240 (-),score=62.57 TRINITY_DN6269_c0_g1_i10:155-874(-)